MVKPKHFWEAYTRPFLPLQFVLCFQSPYSIQDGSTQEGTIQLSGPFGGLRKVLSIGLWRGQSTLYLCGLPRWAKRWHLGAVRGPLGPPNIVLWGRNGPFLVLQECCRGPEVLRRAREAKRAGLFQRACQTMNQAGERGTSRYLIGIKNWPELISNWILMRIIFFGHLISHLWRKMAIVWAIFGMIFRLFTVSDAFMLKKGAHSTWIYLTHVRSRIQAILGPLSHKVWECPSKMNISLIWI